MKPKILVMIGGLLLIVGFAMPWLTVNRADSSVSAFFTGLNVAHSHQSSIYSPLSGFVLVLIGIFGKGKPGKLFSIFGIIVSILCGVLLTYITWFYSSRLIENEFFSYGPTVISPPGVLIGLIGSLAKVPTERLQDAEMVSYPVESNARH